MASGRSEIGFQTLETDIPTTNVNIRVNVSGGDLFRPRRVGFLYVFVYSTVDPLVSAVVDYRALYASGTRLRLQGFAGTNNRFSVVASWNFPDLLWTTTTST